MSESNTGTSQSDEYLDGTGAASNVSGSNLATILRAYADTLDDAPENKRYQFEMSLDESEVNDEQ